MYRQKSSWRLLVILILHLACSFTHFTCTDRAAFAFPPMTELKDLAPLLLKKERAGGDVDPAVLAAILRGSAAKNARRKELLTLMETHPVLSDRDMLFRNHNERYNFATKKAYHYVQLLREKNITDREEQQILYSGLGEPTGMNVHRSMFIPTLENQADDEQQKKWLPLAKSYKILGAYAQTELGHGSNVQGLETTARYDKVAQEFIINSPTLTSRKWWPGGLGKTANHAFVHARLFLDGKDVGIQAFLVQLRSLENHEPLPGIEVGDIGPKVGFNSVDNGYAAFHDVRIPRDQMVMRYAKVLPDGTFVKPKSDKLVYLAMVEVRASLIHTFGVTMAMAATITTRFSAARLQGRKPTSGSGEFQVLDYQNQQNTLFPLIAVAYAGFFAGKSIIKFHEETIAIITSGSGSFKNKLSELHAVSSGLKAWMALKVSDGIEICRRMCGGHGFTNSSNLGHLFAETVGANTFEGTFDVLVQQHARYLVKVLASLSPKASGRSSSVDVADSSTSFLTRSKQYLDPNTRCKAHEPEDFADFQLLLAALKTRAARIAVRLTNQIEATKNEIGNLCMVLMTRSSTAHAELLLFEAFVNGVETVPAGPSKVALATLCALFGAWLIVNSLGDFREDEYLSSAQGELVRQQLARLLPVVRKNAVLFTDAWDFTDFELNSTIGRYDGDIYRALVERAAHEPLNRTPVAESYAQYLRPLIQSEL